MELARALAERGLPGEVVALSGAASGSLPVRTLGRRSRGAGTLRALGDSAGRHSVVVAHGSDTLLAAAAALAMRPTPFVYLSIGDPRQWARGVRRRVNQAALRRARRVAVLSPSALPVVRDWYSLAESRFVVLPNFRDPVQFAPATPLQRAAARRAFGLPAGAPVVALIGALAAEKRPQLAVEAILRVVGAHAVLAGEGPLRPLLEGMARRHPGRVHLLGALPDVRPVLHAADAMVLASTTEGLPGALIEAAMCRVPAVAVDVGWIGDVVRDGETGFLVPDGGPALPALLAERILEVVPRSDELGAAARRLSLSRFSSEVVVPLWAEVLNDVVLEAAG